MNKCHYFSADFDKATQPCPGATTIQGIFEGIDDEDEQGEGGGDDGGLVSNQFVSTAATPTTGTGGVAADGDGGGASSLGGPGSSNTPDDGAGGDAGAAGGQDQGAADSTATADTVTVTDTPTVDSEDTTADASEAAPADDSSAHVNSGATGADDGSTHAHADGSDASAGDGAGGSDGGAPGADDGSTNTDAGASETAPAGGDPDNTTNADAGVGDADSAVDGAAFPSFYTCSTTTEEELFGGSGGGANEVLPISFNYEMYTSASVEDVESVLRAFELQLANGVASSLGLVDCPEDAIAVEFAVRSGPVGGGRQLLPLEGARRSLRAVKAGGDRELEGVRADSSVVAVSMLPLDEEDTDLRESCVVFWGKTFQPTCSLAHQPIFLHRLTCSRGMHIDGAT